MGLKVVGTGNLLISYFQNIAIVCIGKHTQVLFHLSVPLKPVRAVKICRRCPHSHCRVCIVIDYADKKNFVKSFSLVHIGPR